MRTHTRARNVALTLALLAGLAGCGSDESEGEEIVAGVADQHPYSSLNPDGTITGLAPDVTNRILEKLGYESVRGQVATYAELIPGMNAGRWDMIAASLHISAPRCEQVLFADPITLGTSSLAVLPGNPKQITEQIADFPTDARLGILSGSFLVPLAQSYGIEGDQIVEFPDEQGAIAGISAGRVDAFLSTSETFEKLAETASSNFDVVGPVTDMDPSASSVAFAKGEEEFRDDFNEKLREMKSSGELAEILDEWGFPQIPEGYEDFTWEDACKAPH